MRSASRLTSLLVFLSLLSVTSLADAEQAADSSTIRPLKPGSPSVIDATFRLVPLEKHPQLGSGLVRIRDAFAEHGSQWADKVNARSMEIRGDKLLVEIRLDPAVISSC